MATKNLSRTVIEGGRSHYSQDARNASHGTERALVRAALTFIDHDAELIPLRPSVYKGFSDKLRPAVRWLHSHVGRPWKRVRSEIFVRFDTRTTAGRHIVLDHLLPMVKPYGAVDSTWHRHGFWVDRRGILRVAPRQPRTRYSFEPLRQEWLDVLGDCRVGSRGAHLFWFVPTATEDYFRQGARLTDPWAAWWLALPAWFRQKHEVK